MTDQQELWDKERARKHARWMKIGSKIIYAPFARKIVKCIVPLKRYLKILDLGIGPGLLSIEIKKVIPKSKIIGVDLSSEMLKVARKNFDEAGISNYELKLGKAEEIPLESDSVDLVITQSSLHEWENPQKGLSEIFRVLKPKGSLMLKDYNRDWLSKWKYKLLKFHNHLEMFKFNLEEVVDLLRKAGFKKIKGEGRGPNLFVQTLK